MSPNVSYVGDYHTPTWPTVLEIACLAAQMADGAATLAHAEAFNVEFAVGMSMEDPDHHSTGDPELLGIRVSPAPGWSRADSDAALAEGWDIFDCDGSDNGPYQICVLEEPELLPDLGYTEKKFPTDTEVWVHVRDKAVEGSQLHQRALDFVEFHNHQEHVAIMRWEEGTDG